VDRIAGGSAGPDGWPSRFGAAFLIVRLIHAGHTPANAEHWAATIPAWHTAPDATRTAFAAGVLGLWEWLEHTDPIPHRTPLANAVRAWTEYRIRITALGDH